MAFTKIVLTGAVDTIKEASQAVNNLITDLLSTSNVKGASQVGIEDTAGNMSAANVEDALAEIYDDTASQRTEFNTLDENSATTTGTTWGYQAGSVRFDNTITDIAAGTVALTDDATNYVQVNSSGTVSRNTTAFSVFQIPIRIVVVASGVQTTSTDKRTWFQSGPQDLSSTANPTFLGLSDGTYDIDLPTNAMAASVFMLGNSSTIVWFYLNTAPPGWKALSTGADTVLGVAGGAGDYNVNGGNPDTAASWSIDGLTNAAHNHLWHDYVGDDSIAKDGQGTELTSTAAGNALRMEVAASGAAYLNIDTYTDDQTPVISSDSTYRPSASVGKLFQLDTS